MIHFFTYDGVSSRNFGLYISGLKTYKSPERDLQNVEVPGRNGDLVYDRNRYKNIQLPYECYIDEDVADNLEGLQAFLASHSGYHRLEDTLRPEYYRIAKLTGSIDATMNYYQQSAKFTLSFDCKPQRYLKSGESSIEFTERSFDIYNPTHFRALPLLRVYGTGVLGIGSETIEITEADGYTDIDCSLQDAYKETANKNKFIKLKSQEFPYLRPGKSGITLGEGISKIEITPRWETI